MFIEGCEHEDLPLLPKTIEGHRKEIYKRFESVCPALTTAKKGKKEILRDYLNYLKTRYDSQRDFTEISDRPQPPTNSQNISTAPVTDNLAIPSDQEELEIDGSISSWVSEKSYNKFIARDFDLKKLIEYTENGISSKVLSIWGMGGLGKTATCHRLISLLYHQKRFKKIVWINAKRKQFQTSDGKSEQIRESRLKFRMQY